MDQDSSSVHQSQDTKAEIEITSHLLEYFRILIEFEEREKGSKSDSDEKV